MSARNIRDSMLLCKAERVETKEKNAARKEIKIVLVRNDLNPIECLVQDLCQVPSMTPEISRPQVVKGLTL